MTNPRSRQPAAHVAAAIGITVQPRAIAPKPVAKGPAAHVQAALSALPPSRGAIQRTASSHDQTVLRSHQPAPHRGAVQPALHTNPHLARSPVGGRRPSEGGVIQRMPGDDPPAKKLGTYSYQAVVLDGGGQLVPIEFTTQELLKIRNHFGISNSTIQAAFTKLGPESLAYNCHSWSVGYNDRSDSPAGKKLDDFDAFYADYGLERVGEDKAFIAVYGTGRNGLDHVAVKLRGNWTSKLGPNPLVLHKNGLADLEGAQRYGSVQHYYGWKYERPF